MTHFTLPCSHNFLSTWYHLCTRWLFVQFALSFFFSAPSYLSPEADFISSASMHAAINGNASGCWSHLFGSSWIGTCSDGVEGHYYILTQRERTTGFVAFWLAIDWAERAVAPQTTQPLGNMGILQHRGDTTLLRQWMDFALHAKSMRFSTLYKFFPVPSWIET